MLVEGVEVTHGRDEQLPVGHKEHDQAAKDDFENAQQLPPPAVDEGSRYRLEDERSPIPLRKGDGAYFFDLLHRMSVI